MDSSDVLKFRVLLTMRQDENATVTGIARTLGVEKYTVSRIMAALEKKGLLDRSNSRHPKLTAEGQETAAYYAERLDVMLNHLLYGGLNPVHASKDALYYAMFASEEGMDIVRRTDAVSRMKYELRNRRSFGGALMCRHLRDGIYQFPFVIYQDHIENGNILSKAQNSFENPCTLKVENGQGSLHIQMLNSGEDSPMGTIWSMSYLENGMYIPAEVTGPLVVLPMTAFRFINCIAGDGHMFYANAIMRLQYRSDKDSITENEVAFSLIV